MGRYLLFFSYLGNRYRGLQKQVKNSNILDVDCVQGAIESAILTLRPTVINNPIFVPSSRTDSGVHSLQNAAHIEIENTKGLLYHPDSVVQTLNRYMLRCKHEIKILQCVPITNKFHARFSAKSRTYLYRLIVAKKFGDRGIPICEMNRSSLVRFENFDIERAKEATKLFIGLRDFKTFAAVNKSNREIQYRREINELTIEKGSPLLPHDPLSEKFEFWDIKCKARAFVHNQIRRIVGTLCALGAERVTEKEVITMLQVPNHRNWDSRIVPAAPNGLYLVNVEYDRLELKENTIPYNEREFFPPQFDK